MIQKPRHLTTLPSQWRPAGLDELIGPAGQIGRMLTASIANLDADPTARAKFLFYGTPGSGKTELGTFMCQAIGKHALAIERVSGVECTVDVVRQWKREAPMGSLFGDYKVKFIQEVDVVPRTAQDLLLEYMDMLPPRTGVICTSNLQIDLLQERFQTRMRVLKVLGAPDHEVAALLAHWGLSPEHCRHLGFSCGGNVRAALQDADNFLEMQQAGINIHLPPATIAA